MSVALFISLWAVGLTLSVASTVVFFLVRPKGSPPMGNYPYWGKALIDLRAVVPAWKYRLVYGLSFFGALSFLIGVGILVFETVR